MRARASKDGLTLRIIAGSNNALLAMDLEEPKQKGCLGFTIERTDLDTGERRFLPNMIRFEADALDDADIARNAIPTIQATPNQPTPNQPAAASQKVAKKVSKTVVKKTGKKARTPLSSGADQDAPMVSTARAPLQRFRWGDYTLDPGKSYRFRVIPRYETVQKIIDDGKESERRRTFDTIPGGVTVEIRTENNHGRDAAVFFNRGAAASRAYNNRYGDNDPQSIPDALWWLSRGLEEALIAFIGQAVDATFAIHAAIYEFQKPKLLQALMSAVGRNVDVKVAYHARQKLKKGKPDPADKTADKNRAAIKAAGITFAKPRDADPQGAIMHNKFVVLLKKGPGGTMQPIAVWTGSTNWTDGGIYGQLNLGHASYDLKIAKAYDDYFEILFNNDSASAMKTRTQSLTPVPKTRADIPHGVTPIFSPQSKLDMIDLYAELCTTGKVVMVSAPFALHPKILAAFKNTPVDVLRFLMADKGNNLGEVKLLEHDVGNEVSVATTLDSALHDFQGRLLEHEESFHHSGVHIHSKIIAVDPFGQDPILVTGSANFSNNSTVSNDENSLIVRGDTAVMDIYITEFMRMFEHYWFRAHLDGQTPGAKKEKKKKTVGERLAGLKPDDSWTVPYYTAGTRERTERLAFAGLAAG